MRCCLDMALVIWNLGEVLFGYGSCNLGTWVRCCLDMALVIWNLGEVLLNMALDILEVAMTNLTYLYCESIRHLNGLVAYVKREFRDTLIY